MTMDDRVGRTAGGPTGDGPCDDFSNTIPGGERTEDDRVPR
jgi:hypothetical protein